MGTAVLDAAVSQPDLHLYAHSLRGLTGGVAIPAINLSRADSITIELPIRADRYALTAPQLEDSRVRLNGHELTLGPNDELPSLQGVAMASGPVELPPASITFLTLADAGNQACR